jgi:predicted SAM-dependent methyltransferase
MADDARTQLLDYLSQGDPEAPAHFYDVLPAHVKLARKVVTPALRTRLRILATDAMRAKARRQIEAAKQRSPLKIQLGSGLFPKEGWVNIDLYGPPTDVTWNLARGIPFDDGTVDAVFHEHLMEHIPLEAGLKVTEECHRVLNPGGVLRMAVPDAGRYVRSYTDANGDSRAFLERNRPARPTTLLAVQEVFYYTDHQTMYDFETLALVCRAAGFEQVEEASYGLSRLDPVPDSPHRERESLYVEAVKS